MSDNPTLELTLFDPAKHGHLLGELLDLQITTITAGNVLVRFLPPFTDEKRRRMREWWDDRVEDIARGTRLTLIALDSSSSSSSGSSTSAADASGAADGKGGQGRLVGVVELSMPFAETGPFRGEVEMLMVAPACRRHGLARRLMLRLEEMARERGRTLLLLSTTVGSVAAQHFYPKMGWARMGVLPDYGIEPFTGKLVDGVYFYKDLRKN